MAAEVTATTGHSPGRAVAVSTLSQALGKALHLVLNVVSTLAILRYLAPDAYGAYVLVLTVTTLVGVVADFGLPKLAVREIARGEDGDGRVQDEVVGTVVVLRLGLAIAALVGAQGVLRLMGEPPMVLKAAAIASLVVLVDAVLGVIIVCFQVHLVQQYEALVRTVAEALDTALVLLLIALQVSFLWLFVPPVLGLCIGLVLAVALARRRFELRLRPALGRLRHLVREALPLGPALLLGVLYLKLDTLILAALRPSRDVGIYGSAYQPVEYLFLGTAVIINVLFPLLAREWSRGNSERFLQLYRRGTELLVIVTVFVPLVLAFTAPAVVRLMFGTAYAEAADPLRILAVALVAIVISGWQSLVLLAGGRQRIPLIYNTVAVVVAAGLSFLLIRALGPVGAALSALTTSCAVMIASVVAVQRALGATLDPARIGLVLVAAAGTVAVLAGLQAAGTPWVMLAVAAAAVYVTLLHRLGFIRSIRGAFA